MSKWLNKISLDPTDFGPIGDAYDYFERECDEFAKEFDIQGKNIIAIGAKIPGLSEYHYTKMSEVRAICEYLELRLDFSEQKLRKFYLEGYNRKLTNHQVEDYIKGTPEIVVFKELIIRMKFILNRWEGLSRGLERMHHQTRIISDMRRAGFDDATI